VKSQQIRDAGISHGAATMARRRHSHVQVDKAVEVQLLKKSLAHLKLEKAPKAKTARRQMSSTEKGMIIAFFFCFGCIQTVSAIIGRCVHYLTGYPD
jgi:hypothetical protein